MKDKIQRRSAHTHRHHVHNENARVAVAAWAFVVVIPVAVARSLQKRAEFRGSHVQRSLREGNFRRKYRMYLPTFSKLVNLLRPTLERQEHSARELRLGSALFHNFKPKMSRILRTNTTVL